MTAQEPTVSQRVQGLTGRRATRVSILDSAVCVRVKFGKIGTSRKVKNTTTLVKNEETGEETETKVVTVDAEEDLIKISKKLLDSPEMDAINKFYGEVRKYIKSRVNASNIDDGLYWLGLSSIREFEDRMNGFLGELNPLLDKLCEAFEGIVQEDSTRLRGAFDPADYPAADRVREAFIIKWQYIAFTTPRSLEAVSEELFKKAQEDLNVTIQMAQEAVQLALRSEMAQLVDWAIERLSPGEDGKRKILRTKTKTGEEIGLTAKLHSFFETFQGRNITSDVELQALVGKAEALMTGVDGDALKASDTLRESLRQSFSELKAELEPLVADQPIRSIEV